MRTVSIDFDNLLHDELGNPTFQFDAIDHCPIMHLSKLTTKRKQSRDENLMMTLREFVSRKTSAKDPLPEFVSNIQLDGQMP